MLTNKRPVLLACSPCHTKLFLCVVLLCAATAWNSTVMAQCGVGIDLGTWIQEGALANGNWTVGGAGNNVTQSINGDPTFYVSPDSFINVVIQGDIRVNTTNDDDWIGFVFGYESPDTSTNDYDFYIFSWKQNDQNFAGYFGSEGYTLAKMDGPITNLPEAFSSFGGPYVDVIGSQYGNTAGWNDQQTYSFELTYTNTRTVIAINGDTLFDEYGCFLPGRFGFYNYSQSDVTYSNFSYRVAAAFDILTPDVCVGDTALMIALSDSCPSMPGVQVNNTLVAWDWDLGDGNVSSDTNVQHVYTSPGTYTVRLIVTDYIGCKDTAYNTIDITGASAALGNDTAICSNESIVISPQGTGSGYLWQDGSTNATYTVSGPGTYHVTITDSLGCDDSDTIVITSITAPSVDLGNDTSICNHDSLTLVATYPGATYLWQDGSTNDSLLLNQVGTYIVTVFEGVCSDTDDVVITNYASPSVTPPNPSLCYGDTLSISAAGAATYEWFPTAGLTDSVGTTVQTFTLTSTTYSVIGTDTNGCVDTSQFYVEVTPLPTASISGGNEICSGDSVPLSVALTGNGPWDINYTDGTSNFNASGIASPFNFFTGVAGEYTITSVMDSGCNNAGKDSTTVIVHALPPVSATTQNNTLCFGQSTELFVTGAQSYVWTPSATLSSATGNSVTAIPTDTTLFSVAGTDTNGCVDSGFVYIIVNPLPVLAINVSDDTLCRNQSTNMSASGASQYVWDSVPGLNTYTFGNVIATPLVTSTYQLVGTDGNGCTDSVSTTIVVDTLPVIRITPSDTAICIQDSAALMATGAASYSWLPNNAISSTTAASVVVQPTFSLTYSITGTDANGCVGDTTIDIEVLPLPALSVTPPLPDICIGQSEALEVSGAATFQWDNASSLNIATGDSVIASPDSTTLYTITGTDSNGCMNDVSVTLTVHALPNLAINVSDDTLCKNQNTNMSASGANQYMWSNVPGLNTYGSGNVIATPMVTSTYQVLGTDGNGCQDSTTATIVVDTLPTIRITPSDTAFCIYDTATLIASGAADYVWLPNSAISSTTGSTVVVAPTYDITYSITGTDANGCVGDTFVSIDIQPLPVMSVTPVNAEICVGQSQVLQAIGASTIEWDNAGSLSSATGGTVTATPVSTTVYTITGVDTNGCSSTTQANLTVHDLPVLTPTQSMDTICIGEQVNLGVSGALFYAWKNTPGLNTYNGQYVVATPSSSSTYEVVATDNNGCKDSVQYPITVNPLPILSITPPTPAMCIGENIVLTASGASDYVWSPSGTLSSGSGTSVTANPTTTTFYSITGTDTNGCSNSTNVGLVVNPLPVLTLTSSADPVCTESSVTLSAIGAASYVWQPNFGMTGSTTANPVVNPAQTQDYTVTATDANGCVSTGSITVNVFPIPTYGVGPDVEVCVGDSVQLQATGGVSYQWGPSGGLSATGVSDPHAYGISTRTYIVTITDQYDCDYSDEIWVNVNPLPTVMTGGNHRMCVLDTVRLGGNPTGPPGATYTWTPVTHLSNSSMPNPSAFPKTDTEYTVVVTDTKGCTKSRKLTVEVNPTPQLIVIKKPSYICFNTPKKVEVTPGLATYQWSPTDGILDPTVGNAVFSPASSTDYTLVGTDSNGCSRSVNLTMVVKSVPTVNAVDFNEVCEGDTAALFASGALSYKWSNGGSLSDSTSPTPLAHPESTTRYTVTGTDSNGCTNTDSTLLIIHTRPDIDAGDDITNCNMAVVRLGGDPTGPLDATYTWSPAELVDDIHEQNPRVLDTERRMFYLHAVSPYGCESEDSIYVNADCYDQIYAPSAFTPDEDPLMINETFKISYWRVYKPYLKVFDKWGKVIFETNDLDVGWDGRYTSGSGLAPIGVYYWELLYETELGRPKSAQGSVTLLR